MVNDTGTPTPESPQYVSMEDFRKFQSTKDAEVAHISRLLSEERSLNDDIGAELAQIKQQLAEREGRELDADDPRLAAVTKQLRARESELAQHQRFVKQITPQFKQLLVENYGLRLSAKEVDDAAFKMAAEYLSAARNPQEVKALADRLREVGVARTPPPPRGEEVDTGRGAARGGGPPISRALLSDPAVRADPERRRAAIAAAEAALRAGREIPDR